MMMKQQRKMFVFNCATNNSGGAVQNAVNFINIAESLYTELYCIFYILSVPVYEQVKGFLKEDSFMLVETSPARSKKSRKEIKEYVNRINPSLIYTSAGPAYVDFEQVHIMGCSNPYVLGAPKEALVSLGGLKNLIKRSLHTIYQRHYIKKADFWIVQTEYSKEQLYKLVSKNSIFVVSNSISEYFKAASVYLSGKKTNLSTQIDRKHAKILIPSAYYKHKALEKIPEVVAKIKNDFDIDIQVTFTIKDEFWPLIKRQAEIFDVQDKVVNHGVYRSDEAVDLYLNHDVILQPSLLEVFSTSYIEAIAVKKPLVVPHLNFAKGICDKYAYYYCPQDLDSYSVAIKEAVLMFDFENKICHSESILNKYGTQAERVKSIINILDSIS